MKFFAFLAAALLSAGALAQTKFAVPAKVAR
jgi:hypothetical protein